MKVYSINMKVHVKDEKKFCKQWHLRQFWRNDFAQKNIIKTDIRIFAAPLYSVVVLLQHCSKSIQMKLHLKQLSHYFLAIICLLLAPYDLFAEEQNSGGDEVPFAAITCYNQNYCCDYWGDHGKCSTNEFVKYSCPATCRECVRSVPKSSTFAERFRFN
jgi:hypothetical protein